VLDRHPEHRFTVVPNIIVSLLAIAATSLEVIDVLSTYHLLSRGGHEANPIVEWFMEVLGEAWPLCKLPEVAVIVILWAFAPRPIAVICLGLMVIGYSFVVWHNYQF
jgi:hypothetical protein